MSMVDDINSAFVKHRATVRIGGRRFLPVSIQVDHGVDMASSQVRIQLSGEDAARLGTEFRDLVEVDLGYGTWEVPAFRGFLENDDPGYWPQDNVVEASGPMKRMQYEAKADVTYSSQTDVAIVSDVLSDSGIDNHSIEGPDPSLTLGTLEDVILKAGTPPFNLVRQIDEVAGFVTFDCPDGIVRRRPATGLPSSTAAFAYVQGYNIIDISAPRTTSNMRNKVVVTGLRQGSSVASATQQADNSLIPDPPGYVAEDYSNDFVETDDVAAAVAAWRLRLANRVTREITLEVPGNPLLFAGMTISIQAEKARLPVPQNFVIKHVSHTWGARFVTKVVVEGGVGPEGYPVYDNLGPPEAIASTVITAEGWEVAGTPTQFYTASFNGLASYDPNGPAEELEFAWENNKNADVSTTPYYATRFTAAELATATATLTVTDRDGEESSVTVNMESTVTPILTKSLWLALDDVAKVSLDGGMTWTEFEAPYDDSTVRRWTVVSEIGRDGYNYFGAIGSKGLGTDLRAHWLVLIDMARPEADRMVPLHDFGTASGNEITAIWAHEFNTQRIIVGLANGQIWASSNIDQEKFAQWHLLVTLPDPIEWLIESMSGIGEIRAAAGESLYITFDGFANYSELVDFTGGTAYRQALSPFGNYVAGDLSPDAVLTESGDPITLPGTPNLPILGLTHHIRRDILFAGDQDGQTYRKEEGETEFVATAAITSGAAINHMIRDGDNESVVYIAAADGIYKTYDLGETIVQVMSWNPVTYPDRAGLRIGYGGQVADAAAEHAECYTGFYNQREFITEAPGGPSYLMHASREGSQGAYKNRHYFATDGNWYAKLIALGEIPGGDWFGVNIHAVQEGVGDVNMGVLEEVGDEVDMDGHGSWTLPFTYWYNDTPGLDEELPAYFEIIVCPRGEIPDDVEIVVESSTDAKWMLRTGTPPSGWRTVGFDRSDWPAMVDIGEPDDIYTTAPLIWRNDVASPPAEELLIAHPFEVTGMDTIQNVGMVIRCNNSAAGIWLNDQYIRSIPASGDADGDSEPFEIVINPAALVIGDNVLAIHAVNAASGGGDTLAWVSYRLVVGGA